MESIVIVVPEDQVALMDQKIESLSPAMSDGGRLLIVGEGARIYITRDSEVIADFEEDRLGQILNRVSRPVFYVIDYSDIVLCRQVLEKIADDHGVLVDNDHGVLAHGDEYLDMLRLRPNWDWRLDSP